LSYANEHRPWKLFEAVFYQLLGQCQQAARHARSFGSRTSCCCWMPPSWICV
jgi:hypothetical protein